MNAPCSGEICIIDKRRKSGRDAQPEVRHNSGDGACNDTGQQNLNARPLA